MLVLKFGGTSVGSAQRMREVLQILKNIQGRKLGVLSAMSGTTNALVGLNDLIIHNEVDEVANSIETLKQKYFNVAHELFENQSQYYHDSIQMINEIFGYIEDRASISQRQDVSKEILAQGELLSTKLFHLLALSESMSVGYLPALDFMRLDEKAEPFLEKTSALLNPIMDDVNDTELLITQGYICRNHWGEIDNLQRGGSDYTATILGAVLNSQEIQIWTDIDGIHNNDPRIVDTTNPVRKLAYREAAELAYFGAKILHPTCVLPAERMNVPLRLKFTADPDAPGTLISNEISDKPITAIAAKDGITTINIYSSRMLMAYGFLKKVFQVFEDHKTPVDMITTSEVAVTLTIDDISRLELIENDLSVFSEVSINHDYTIICIVGNELYDDSNHVNRIFDSLKAIPIRMVSMGGSRYNMSLLVKTEYKNAALTALNSVL